MFTQRASASRRVHCRTARLGRRSRIGLRPANAHHYRHSDATSFGPSARPAVSSLEVCPTPALRTWRFAAWSRRAGRCRTNLNESGHASFARRQTRLGVDSVQPGFTIRPPRCAHRQTRERFLKPHCPRRVPRGFNTVGARPDVREQPRRGGGPESRVGGSYGTIGAEPGFASS